MKHNFLLLTPLMGAIFLPVALFGPPSPFLGSAVLLGSLIYLSVFDWLTFRLPDYATYLLAALGAVATWQTWPQLLSTHAMSALIVGVGLRVLATLWWRLRGYEVLGLGDVKLIAAAALWVGPAVSYVVLIGSATALAFAFGRRVLWTTNMNDPIPFGPFLCSANWGVWCWYVS